MSIICTKCHRKIYPDQPALVAPNDGTMHEDCKFPSSWHNRKPPASLADQYDSTEQYPFFDEHGFDCAGWTNYDWRTALNPDEGDHQ